MLAAFGASDWYGKICEWYQDYHFGDMEIFNPVSLMSCLANDGEPRDYWGNTAHNTVIAEALDYATPSIIEDVSRLLSHETVNACIREELVYPKLPDNPNGVFTLLLANGYLTAAR